MAHGVVQTCEFSTNRLTCGPWQLVAARFGFDLAAVVAGLLTESTTAALPDAWRGDYSEERARSWIDERNNESPTLLIVDTATAQPVGLTILFESAEHADLHVRLGYLFAETSWGQGLASEMLAGFVGWAREHGIKTLTGGVVRSNAASARVLVKSGFELASSEGPEDVYVCTL